MAWIRRPISIDHVDSGFEQERRAAILQAQEERGARRQRDLQAQAAPQNDPQVRITTWERLHALSLPRSTEHALVRLIARQTALTLSQVRDEQERRAGVVSG
jgi:hypothetical protein